MDVRGVLYGIGFAVAMGVYLGLWLARRAGAGGPEPSGAPDEAVAGERWLFARLTDGVAVPPRWVRAVRDGRPPGDDADWAEALDWEEAHGLDLSAAAAWHEAARTALAARGLHGGPDVDGPVDGAPPEALPWRWVVPLATGRVDGQPATAVCWCPPGLPSQVRVWVGTGPWREGPTPAALAEALGWPERPGSPTPGPPVDPLPGPTPPEGDASG